MAIYWLITYKVPMLFWVALVFIIKILNISPWALLFKWCDRNLDDIVNQY